MALCESIAALDSDHTMNNFIQKMVNFELFVLLRLLLFAHCLTKFNLEMGEFVGESKSQVEPSRGDRVGRQGLAAQQATRVTSGQPARQSCAPGCLSAIRRRSPPEGPAAAAVVAAVAAAALPSPTTVSTEYSMS